MKTAAIIGGVYALGGLVTLGLLASVGDARVAAGKKVFVGVLGTEGPGLQVAETFLFWPAALLVTFLG